MSTLPPGYPQEPDDLIDNSPETDPDDAYEEYRASRDEALEEDAGLARQEARREDRDEDRLHED